MKKKLFLLLLAFIGCIGAFAQTLPASALWPLTSTTTIAVTTSGQVTAEPEFFKNTEVNGYTGTNNSQRVRMAGTSNSWPAGLTYQIDTVYIQFAISAKAGNKLTIDSIAMDLAVSSSSTFEANIYYSKDPKFAKPDTIRHTKSTANNYLTSKILHISKKSLGLVLNSGETLYVRVYPWHENASKQTGKYLNIQNVVISGQTESLPVASSVVWPMATDLSNVVTGNLIAGSPTLSNLTQYGKLAYNGKNGLSYYTNAIWQPETAPAEGRYLQISASPKSGGTLVVDSITLKLAAWYTNDFRVSVYYSKDPNFTMSTGTVLVQNVAVTSGTFTKIKGSLNLTVNSGETIYCRLYPYHLSLSGDKNKLIGLNDVSIFGKVTGVTADLATITTTAISDISTTFIATGGNISSDGGATVTERGVCWNTATAPTIANSKTSEGSGSGTFKSVPKGLTANTTYYLRAFATNSAGTSYGNEISFTTLAAKVVPTLTTVTISNIMDITAKGGGNITAWGGDTIKSRGICWNTTGTPTIADSKTDNGSGTGSFSSLLYPLTPNTDYFVRAYSTNSVGTGYGDVQKFTTQAIAPDVKKVVAKDGSGDYTTVQAAFDAVTSNYTGRWMIYVKPGKYYEKLLLPAGKVNVILYSMHPDSVVLYYDDYAGKASGASTLGTFNSYSTDIEADDFTAMNITFKNTIKNDGKTSSAGEQALALRTNGDRQQFYNCKLYGYQDTYLGGANLPGRAYFKKSWIEGSVDFIFGMGTVIFDQCNIHANREGACLTAPSTDFSTKYGFVFINDTLSAEKGLDFAGKTITNFSLGRPWQNGPRCAYINCVEPATVVPAGWTSMSVNPVLFAEYKCTGPGFSPTTRSTVATSAGRQLTDAEAVNYTISNVFDKTTNPNFGYDWIPAMPNIPGIFTDVSKVSIIDGHIKLFPNPATETVTIQREESKVANMAIYDMTGSKVSERVLHSDLETINVSTLPKGLYIIVLEDIKFKFVVK